MTTALRKSAEESPDRIVRDVIEDAFRFFGDRPRKDDVTLVVGKIS